MKSNSDNIDKHKHTHRGSSHKQAACVLPWWSKCAHLFHKQVQGAQLDIFCTLAVVSSNSCPLNCRQKERLLF